MANRSYEYRALCQVCRTKMWNYELRKRWDELWCCKQCWEIRHPMDFYRGRSDAHLLSWTSSDSEIELAWTAPALSSLTSVAATNETLYQPDGTYVLGTDITGASVTTGRATLIQWIDNRVGLTGLVNQPAGVGQLPIGEPSSTTSNSGGSIVLPTVPTTGGTLRYITSYGVYLGSQTILAATQTVTSPPTWTKKPGHVYVSFIYGT